VQRRKLLMLYGWDILHDLSVERGLWVRLYAGRDPPMDAPALLQHFWQRFRSHLPSFACAR
jgi:hypothetical protein